MPEIRLRYTASVFVSADSIVPNSQIIAALMELLGEGLLPVMAQEQTPLGLRTRLAFMTPNQEWQVVVRGDRVDVSKLATTHDGSNLGAFDEFCAEAGQNLTLLIRHFDLQGNRLAATQEGVLRQMSAGELAAAVSNLLHLPDGVSDSPPFEWDWRAAWLINHEVAGQEERVNTLATLKRQQFALSILPPGEGPLLDRIKYEFDTNTNPANNRARFETEHIRSFFDQAPTWHEQLSGQVLQLLN